MHFVEIGQRLELLGEVADLLDRADIAVHRVDAFEGDQFRARGIVILDQRAQMADIIVAEDAPVAAGTADTLDHRGMVERIGIDDQARQDLAERGKRGVIGDIAGGEQQRAGLAVKRRQLGLEVDVKPCRAGNVARAAGTGTEAVDRLVHGIDDIVVLAHAEIVVRAPDGDLAFAVGKARRGPGKASAMAVQVDKDPVTPLAMDSLQRVFKSFQVFHGDHRSRFLPELQPVWIFQCLRLARTPNTMTPQARHTCKDRDSSPIGNTTYHSPGSGDPAGAAVPARRACWRRLTCRPGWSAP